MPVIENSVSIPAISATFHTLQVEGVDAVIGSKYAEPETPETRLRVTLRVKTPGESGETFTTWMSTSLSERATFGSIVKAILGETPTEDTFDTDRLLGGRFRCMVGHNERQWPRLINGTVGPAVDTPAKSANTAEPTLEPSF